MICDYWSLAWKTLEEASKYLSLQLMKSFKVWTLWLKIVKKIIEICLYVLGVCLHSLKHKSLSYTAQWIFPYVPTHVTVTQIKINKKPPILSLSKLHSSPFRSKTCRSSNPYPDLLPPWISLACSWILYK